MSEMVVDGVSVTVIRKKIRSMNIYVKAPDGEVRVSVPERTSDRMIRRFVASHIDWIEVQRQKMLARHVVHHFVTGERYPVFGVPYTLVVQNAKTKRTCGVYKDGKQLMMTAMPQSTEEERKALLNKWQRTQLQDVAAVMLHNWADKLGVEVKEWHIRRMRTKWGTCNYYAHRIWLSLALAEQPVECVEYVVVHELVHLLVPNHSTQFWALMSQYMPDWKERRTKLNTPQKT
ncbi:MAG: M48 family metallopeptidase [Clostridia bacterium]|nr:M48 family metallopeptidase [Clostridia bacterium]